MSLSESILLSVITNAAKADEIPDDYGVAWYRGMITAAQHDDQVNQKLLLKANKTVDALRARRDTTTVARTA